MWNTIGEVLKIFLEKHLIPTVIAAVGSIALFLVLPGDYWMITKLGKMLFLILVAGSFFLIVQLLMVIFLFFSNMQSKAYIRKESERISMQEEKRHLEEWLSFVDSLSPEDRDLILRFIETRNQPIIVSDYAISRIKKYQNSIYNTNAMVSIENRDCSRKYKLNEQFYQTMKAIYEKRGSISHF